MNLEKLTKVIKPLDLSVAPVCGDQEKAYFRLYNIDFEDRIDGVIHHFGHLSSGKYEIVSHYFEKNGATETCFLMHGYYDHSGLYAHLIEYCLRRNCSVVIFDLPGHGLSTGEPASIGSFQEYQTVLRDVLQQFASAVPHPWHLIAHSTGAAVAMDYLLTESKSAFDKVVLLAPLVYPVKWRWSSLSYEVIKFFLKRLPRKFSPSSSDQDFLDFREHKDPLQSRYLSGNWVGALKQWIKYFIAKGSADYFILVLQGEEDETVDWRRNMPIVKEKFPKAQVCHLKAAGHHLVNEKTDIREKLFAAIDVYFDRS